MKASEKKNIQILYYPRAVNIRCDLWCNLMRKNVKYLRTQRDEKENAFIYAQTQKRAVSTALLKCHFMT